MTRDRYPTALGVWLSVWLSVTTALAYQDGGPATISLSVYPVTTNALCLLRPILAATAFLGEETDMEGAAKIWIDCLDAWFVR